MRKLLPWWGPLLALSGCSLVVDADAGSLGTRPGSCEPGEVEVCACAGLPRGSRVCLSSGRFSVCVCPAENFERGPADDGSAGRGE